MVLSPQCEDFYEHGISVALVPQKGGPGGDALGKVDVNVRARLPCTYVHMAGMVWCGVVCGVVL